MNPENRTAPTAANGRGGENSVPSRHHDDTAAPRPFNLAWRWRFLLAAREHPKGRAHMTLLLTLADTVNTGTGVAWWSVGKLAEGARLSERRCRSGLAALAKAGLIEREASPGGPASATCRYRLKMPATPDAHVTPATDCTPDAHVTPAVSVTPDTNVREGGRIRPRPLTQTSAEPALRTGSTEPTASKVAGATSSSALHGSAGPNQCREEAEIEASAEGLKSGHQKSVDGLAAGFDHFWSSYPKKVAKADARKAWVAKRIGTRPELVARILEDVRTRTARHRPWLDGFTPHPATYIRGERWEDALDERGPKGNAAAPAERAPVTHDAIATQRRLVAESEARARKEWEAKQAARAAAQDNDGNTP